MIKTDDNQNLAVIEFIKKYITKINLYLFMNQDFLTKKKFD